MLAQSGQVTVEYFLLFAAIGVVTVVGFSNFDRPVRQAVGEFFRSATRCVSTTQTAGSTCQPQPTPSPSP